MQSQRIWIADGLLVPPKFAATAKSRATLSRQLDITMIMDRILGDLALCSLSPHPHYSAGFLKLQFSNASEGQLAQISIV